ncbi:pectinesterase-like [Silene latifolia]|uniref:pectinesterase-like n=1 Tax=Silene latifolia TaxID=37657 RepID=UPI003D789D3E
MQIINHNKSSFISRCYTQTFNHLFFFFIYFSFSNLSPLNQYLHYIISYKNTMNIPRKAKLLILPISILTIVFLTLIPTFKHSQKTHIHLHIHKNVEIATSHCDGTLYPDLCIQTLSKIPNLHKKSMAEVVCHTLNVTEDEVKTCETNVSGIECANRSALSPLQKNGLKDCLELLDSTIDELKAVYSEMTSKCGPARHFTDMTTFLSAAMTNQYTCLEGFGVGSNRTIRKHFQPGLYRISHHVSNSLAMLKKVRGPRHCNSSSPYPSDDDDLAEANRVDQSGFPGWMKRRDRGLLQVSGSSANATKFDLVVAKDGSGNFTTIGDAVAAAPNKSDTRYVIYIKAGAYFENVEVDKKKTNIMFLGDGIGKTNIKGNRNVIDGWTTFRSATLAVVGTGFIAKGITVENYAGPSKHQAVALRSGSDLSAFYQCSFIGYQDTLYTHSLRQFYRECDIYGTVDFIFGNAAVVFQNCNLYARKPLDNQKNIFTAQGREDPNQNTGISILNCKVSAASDLAPNKTAFKSYLGRPWKLYSRTVYMFSNIEDVVDPAGWLEWDGDFALDTLYYGEYMNRGAGSNTSARVKWPGYRVINSSSEASNFTVANFIEGGVWLPKTGFPFYLNLTA